MTAAAVNTGGSGYVVGDVLTVVGGVGTPTQLTVAAVDPVTGAVTAVSISLAGGYTTQPGNPVSVTDGTTPAATGATFNLTTGLRHGAVDPFTLVNPGSYTATPFPALGNQVVEEVSGTPTVAVGGTGYKVNDLLNVVGGSFTTPAQLKVTSIGAGGAITALWIVQVTYTVVPSSMPVSVTDITTGAATGALINLTYTSSGTARSSTSSTPRPPEPAASPTPSRTPPAARTLPAPPSSPSP